MSFGNFGLGLVVTVLVLIGGMKILQKAGYPMWCVLFMLIPVVNVIAFLLFAFSEWPSQRAVAAPISDQPALD